MKIEIWDCNNWIRKVFEKDTTGLALRNQFQTAYHSPNPMIFVFDGENGKETRRKVFPGYKGKRKPGSDEFYIQLELFKMLVECTNKTSICIPGWEADDVVATLVRAGGFEGFEVEIRSTDGDFLVLCENGVSVTEPSKKLEHVPVQHLRLYKTLCGDDSDNISGLPTFGPGTFKKMMGKGADKLWYAILESRDLGSTTKEELYITSGQYLWLQSNFELLLAFWDIISFIPVPQDLLDAHTKVGTPNIPAANAILATVFQ